MPRLRLARLAPFALLAVAVPAHAAIGEWASGEHVRLRLVATHDEDGALQGLIEMELEPGWKTYWRSPGDAGIPPRFDFSASRNAAGAEVDFPAPERSDDGFAASNVYHDRVALPVRFSTSTAGQPVRLDLAADLGVCDEVCLPVAVKAVLDVSADDRDNAADGMIREARAALPGPGRPGASAAMTARRSSRPKSKPAAQMMCCCSPKRPPTGIRPRRRRLTQRKRASRAFASRSTASRPRRRSTAPRSASP